MKLPDYTIQRMYQDAEVCYPNESAGYILGFGDGIGVLTVDNQRSGKKFLLQPIDNHLVIGVYHSHPDAESVPSRFDEEYAVNGYYYVIVSVIEGKAKDHRIYYCENGRLTEVD